jgi:hypothetical protein
MLRKKMMKKNQEDELIASEDNECMILVEYLNLRGLLFTHLANETPAGKYVGGVWMPNFATLKRNKAMGVNKGFPDYVIIIPAERAKDGRARLLAIEMKREKNGWISREQKIWIMALSMIEGVEATVAHGYEEAKEFIEIFLI